MSWALLSAMPACAQFSGSATVLSDDRYRGVSLSEGRPAVQLALAYDWPGGGYAGAQASSVRFARGGNGALLQPYLGYAHRFGAGLAWDVGIRYSRFTDACDCSYAELHAGLGSERLGVRLHYAPDYFGRAPAVYVELDASRELSARVRLVGHVGVLRHADGSEADDAGDRYRHDLRVGLALALDPCEVLVSWGTSDGDGAYPRGPYREGQDRNAWVLAVSRQW